MHQFLIGKKLYQTLDLAEFNRSKAEFLTSFYSSSNLTDREKWNFLIDQYLMLEDLDFKQSFNTFMSSRTSISTGDTKISLKEFLAFLENFYFFLVQQDKKFTLTAQQKLKLINGLREISNPGSRICEPGILTRLQQMMTELTTDAQWIPSALYRQRRNYLTMLAEEYNQANQVTDGMSIHTIKRMQQLAHRLPLGGWCNICSVI